MREKRLKQDALVLRDEMLPQASYPDETYSPNNSSGCRRCNNGRGDGICGRHANMFRRSLQRLEYLSSHRSG